MPKINPYNTVVREVATKFKICPGAAFNDKRRTGTRRLSLSIRSYRRNCIWVHIFALLEIKEKLDASGLEYLDLYIHHNSKSGSYHFRTKICIVTKA